MVPRKEDLISLRRDMGHVLWSGLRLQDGVDIEFRIRRYGEHTISRLISVKLVKGDRAVDLVTGGLFEMDALGADYTRLESLGAELAVISRLTDGIQASMDGTGVLLRVDIQGIDCRFMLYAEQEGRLFVDRFEWFVDPSEMVLGGVPIHQPHPVAQLFQ